jgi:hypothetical protein
MQLGWLWLTAGSAAHAQLMEADIGVNPTFEQN